MGRMLQALKQLEGKPVPPRQGRESSPRQQTPPADTAIEAALARIQLAAAAVDREQTEAPCAARPACPSLGAGGQVSQAYRQLAENILCQVESGASAVLMFTSPDDRAGKTASVVSLASPLAERTEGGVLLLDADLRKPDLANHLGVTAPHGLATVLTGTVSWQQVVRGTPIPDVDLLPGAKSARRRITPAQRPRLRTLLEELRNRYRLVLIDTPSLAHAGVAGMAACCDGTYLVVRLRRTTDGTLRRAVEVIRACRGRLLGGVLIGRDP
jgi:Mrp family chromosome partitioning ATPase